MGKQKFEFKLEEDRGFIIHDGFPKCKALLGDDDDLIAKVEWEQSASDQVKESLIESMTSWYWSDFQGVDPS